MLYEEINFQGAELLKFKWNILIKPNRIQFKYLLQKTSPLV